MSNAIKAAMKKYFDALETLYKNETGDLPYFPYDATLLPIIYVGTPTMVAESECELLPVLPGREIDEFVVSQFQYLQYCTLLNRPIEYTPIGSEVESSNAIVVNNMNGKVFVEDIEAQTYKQISDSLASFIEMLN